MITAPCCARSKQLLAATFTRMPFGLTSASEVHGGVFQKKNESEGITDVHIMVDNIIIATTTVDNYDAILHNVLERACECT